MALGFVERLVLPIMLNIFVQLFHLNQVCSSPDTKQPLFSFGSSLKKKKNNLQECNKATTKLSFIVEQIILTIYLQ